MRIFLILLFSVLTASAQYTEFYINNSGGGQTNSGSTSASSPVFAAQSGFWTNATGWWKAGGAVDLSGVSVGMWASVYPNGSLATAYVAIITNVSDANDTIAVSLVARGGTDPADDTAGATSIVVGGAWLGPGLHTANTGYAATNTFPFTMMAGSMTNGTTSIPRYNIKSGTTYNITNGLVISGIGPFIVQGYTTSPGDGGRSQIDGGTVYPYYNLLAINGNTIAVADLEFANNGASGTTTDGITGSGSGCSFYRVVVHNVRKNGIINNGANWRAYSCEAYACNTGGTGGAAGFNSVICTYCISHDNSGAGSDGFAMSSTAATYLGCIADSNARSGFALSGNASTRYGMFQCVAYNNTHAGILLSAQGAVEIQNSILAKNGSGVTNSSSTLVKDGNILNCIITSGTEANTHGFTTNFYGIPISGTITYTANQLPWVDAPNGNFTLTASSAAKAAGLVEFTETASSYTGTVAYPDIGAAQGAATNGAAATGGSYTFSQ